MVYNIHILKSCLKVKHIRPSIPIEVISDNTYTICIIYANYMCKQNYATPQFLVNI